MSEEALNRLNDVASQNRTTVVERYHNDWSQAEGFAEDAVLRFALRNVEFASLFAQQSQIREFPLSVWTSVHWPILARII